MPETFVDAALGLVKLARLSSNRAIKCSRPVQPPPQGSTLSRWRRWARQPLLVGVGLLLLAAAALKLGAGYTGPLGRNSVLFSPAARILSVVAEVALGVWLLGGWSVAGAWATTLLFFVAMSGVSLWLAVQGQSSCGCFGRMAVHPWATFGLDVGVVTALAWTRPDLSELRGEFVAVVRPTIQVVLVTASFLYLADHAGLADVVRHRVLGEVLRPELLFVDFGQVSAGESAERAVIVRNFGSEAVRLVGGTSGCSCLVTDVPQTVHPGSSAAVKVRLKVPPDARGAVNRRIVLWTDSTGQPSLGLTVGFEVP